MPVKIGVWRFDSLDYASSAALVHAALNASGTSRDKSAHHKQTEKMAFAPSGRLSLRIKQEDPAQAQILHFVQNDSGSGIFRVVQNEQAERKILRHALNAKKNRFVRQDFIPPSGNSGNGGYKKFEFPTTTKESLKTPARKTGVASKKEKPKPTVTKVQGAVLWKDCPNELFAAARQGMVSALVMVGEIVQPNQIPSTETVAKSIRVRRSDRKKSSPVHLKSKRKGK